VRGTLGLFKSIVKHRLVYEILVPLDTVFLKISKGNRNRSLITEKMEK